ncbi:MAG: hypothetical protein HWD92_02775 [Flavobacteriia bacterium]|nr:hypothetical protein [Flavobacteriia bacterium]
MKKPLLSLKTLSPIKWALGATLGIIMGSLIHYFLLGLVGYFSVQFSKFYFAYPGAIYSHNTQILISGVSSMIALVTAMSVWFQPGIRSSRKMNWPWMMTQVVIWGALAIVIRLGQLWFSTAAFAAPQSVYSDLPIHTLLACLTPIVGLMIPLMSLSSIYRAGRFQALIWLIFAMMWTGASQVPMKLFDGEKQFESMYGDQLEFVDAQINRYQNSHQLELPSVQIIELRAGLWNWRMMSMLRSRVLSPAAPSLDTLLYLQTVFHANFDYKREFILEEWPQGQETALYYTMHWFEASEQGSPEELELAYLLILESSVYLHEIELCERLGWGEYSAIEENEKQNSILYSLPPPPPGPSHMHHEIEVRLFIALDSAYEVIQKSGLNFPVSPFIEEYFEVQFEDTH